MKKLTTEEKQQKYQEAQRLLDRAMRILNEVYDKHMMEKKDEQRYTKPSTPKQQGKKDVP